MTCLRYTLASYVLYLKLLDMEAILQGKFSFTSEYTEALSTPMLVASVTASDSLTVSIPPSTPHDNTDFFLIQRIARERKGKYLLTQRKGLFGKRTEALNFVYLYIYLGDPTSY